MEQTLGKRIVANRKRLNLTQEQLAEQLGVTAQAVSKWENDQTCPDIGMLPKLAGIFGISTDELLGSEPQNKVHQAEVVDEGGVHVRTGSSKRNWVIRWDSGRRSAVCLALWVLSVGILYLFLSWRLSFWDILWPTAVLVLGIGGLWKKWSFFSLACTLFGGYALADKIFQFPFDIGGKTVWAILIILFGFSLLADAIKKPLKPKIVINTPNKKAKSDYTCNNISGVFAYDSSFGDNRQPVVMDTLRKGDVSVSFGDYTVDLTGVENVAPDCHIDAHCSFGELEFIVPKRFRVIAESSTSFASMDIEGVPDASPVGQIQLSGDVSFGEITIKYA